MKTEQVKIEGYDFTLFYATSYDNVQAVSSFDNDKTPREKEMFDKLVFYNSAVYNAPTKERVISQVGEFIRNNK